jgi:hypothetical protein
MIHEQPEALKTANEKRSGWEAQKAIVETFRN